MKHDLKIWPEYFDAVKCGDKSFDLRFDDRRYQVGDTLTFREWSPDTGRYSGRQMKKVVTYVLRGAGGGAVPPLRGLARDYCILGLAEPK